MANPAPTINQINAFNATQGTTIDFNIIGGTELIRSNRIYIYDLSDNSLICTHLYVSTESIHELPPNTDGSIVYESGKSSADFVNGAQYYAQIQTYTDTNGTQGGSGLSVAKMFWCLGDPTLTITTIPSTISTTSYNISATYTNTSASVVSNIIQQYQFNLYSATGSLLQSSGVVVGSGTQQGTSAVYDISHNFTGLNVGSSYYVTVDVTTTQGMSVTTQSNTFTVSIDTPTLGEATVVNNACDGYISVTSNLSGEYGGSGSGEIVSFETDSENVFSKLQVELEPTQEGSGNPSPSNVRPIRGHSGVDVNVSGKNLIPPKNSFSTTANGITVDYDGDVYRIYGTNTKTDIAYSVANWADKFNGFEPEVVYTISTTMPLPRGLYLGVNTKDTSGTSTTAGDHSYLYGNGIRNSNTFTCRSDSNGYLEGFFGVQANCGTVDVTFKIQLEKGSTATPYEPYQQPQTISQDFNVSLTPTSTDTTPYLFKAVGDVYGDRLEDKIVGGTVAWNQCWGKNVGTEAGITYTKENEIYHVVKSTTSNNGLMSSYTIEPNGHKYYISFSGKSDNENVELMVSIGRALSLALTNTMQKKSGIVYAATSGNARSVIYYYSPSGVECEYDCTEPIVVDLTAMFGAGNEPSIEAFEAMFPASYYPYNAGELLSVEGLQSHDTVGFNQWDEEWEVGDINATTGANASGNFLRSKNYIHIFPNTRYYVKMPVGAYLYYYDANKNYLGHSASLVANAIFDAIDGASFMRFVVGSTYGTTYNHDICINLSNPSRNGEYEPYEKHSYPLDSSLTLRGIPKLDASNNLYYDGDEYESDGIVNRRFRIDTYDGSEAWEKDTDLSVGGTKIHRFYLENNDIKKYTNYTDKMLANKCGATNSYDNPASMVGDFAVTGFPYTTFNNNWMYILSKTVDTVEGIKAWLAEEPLQVLYELATPTTETATPYTNPQIVSKYGTLEYVTNSIVPVGHKTTYLTRDIFGGYVDLISGKLVVTHVAKDIGSLYLQNYKTGGFRTVGRLYPLPINSTIAIDDPILIVSMYRTYPASATLQSGQACIAGDSLYFVNADYPTDVNAFKQAMNGQLAVYELATPQTYQLTPQQVNTLVGTNNVWSEQGNIELSYHIPITNLLVKRQDVDDVSGGWLTLYSQPISQASDMDFTFIDFLNQYGKTYKYALVPLLTQTQSGVEVEVEGGYTVSDEVQSVFDGVFIADSTGSQKCKANVGYGNVDMNQVVGSITPIGAKYPIIVTNSHNQYHNGSISGTIVPDDYYFNGNLSRIDMVNKRNELEQFLTNKRVKVIKDWNGNIWLVMIAGNVSCTFNNNYGMGIVNFSTNWTEVGDPTNQQDLQATGLINVGGV